jgi:hypothetical protein
MLNTPEWAMGDASQKQWALRMAKRGYCVLPVYDLEDQDHSTKAPMLFDIHGVLVSPDVLLLKLDKKWWHDVKAKSVPTWRRIPPGPRWEHGCDMANAEQYLKVQDATGIPMYIIVHEQRSPKDETQDSALIPKEQWLAIHITRAFAVGDLRSDWPGGKRQPNRRGRCGKGGLLWARSEMAKVRL